MQVDPIASYQDLWSWQQDIADGQAVLSGLNGPAFWASQVTQFQQWNTAHPTATVAPPSNTTEANCVFSYSPAGSQHSYSDAEWIKQYNGAAVNYIAWQNSNPNVTPYWQLTPTSTVYVNGVAQQLDYVNLVCSQTP
jgi:hypothetical protein